MMALFCYFYKTITTVCFDCFDSNRSIIFILLFHYNKQNTQNGFPIFWNTRYINVKRNRTEFCYSIITEITRISNICYVLFCSVMNAKQHSVMLVIRKNGITTIVISVIRKKQMVDICFFHYSRKTNITNILKFLLILVLFCYECKTTFYYVCYSKKKRNNNNSEFRNNRYITV